VRSDWLDFDIPAQPLETALYRFGNLSHQPALFPSEIIAGRVSSAVHGRYSAEAALQLLLSGTGLSAMKVASAHGEVFVLKQSAVGKTAAERSLDGYPALIQTRILQALCADAFIAPGSYRSLFRIQIDGNGRIRQARLIDSTGDRRRDAALLAALRQVRVGIPPSNAMRLPFVMMLSPVSAGAASPCGEPKPGRLP
jgi:TonB family protein